MSKEPTNQHFVPQVYLRKFSFKKRKDDFIYTLDCRQVETGEIKEKNIKEICAEKGLYDLPGKLTDAERFFVDNFYKSEYENNWNGVYNKLVDEKVTTITTLDRRVIIGMVLSLFFRNIKWIAKLDFQTSFIIEQGYKVCTQYGKDRFVMTEIDGKKEIIVVKGKTLSEVKQDYLERHKEELVIKGMKSTINLLKNRKDSDGIVIEKLRDPSEHFITSDNPVYLFDPDGIKPVNPENPKNFLVVPIDHEHYLELIPERPKQSILDVVRNPSSKLVIGKIKMSSFGKNALLASEADQFLLGSKGGLKDYCSTVTWINNPKDR